MNVITNKISIDLLTESDQSPVVYAVQGECNTRAVELSLFCGGSPWQIPADALLAAICGHQRPLVRWQTATVRCVSGQPELAFSRRFCGGERPVCGPAATYSK